MNGFSLRTGAGTLAALVLAGTAIAQTPTPNPQPTPVPVRLPQISQAATVKQTVGLNDVTITYSRPGVKGRKIWGALVPYGAVWRTGANSATTEKDAALLPPDAFPPGACAVLPVRARVLRGGELLAADLDRLLEGGR